MPYNNRLEEAERVMNAIIALNQSIAEQQYKFMKLRPLIARQAKKGAPYIRIPYDMYLN